MTGPVHCQNYPTVPSLKWVLFIDASTGAVLAGWAATCKVSNDTEAGHTLDNLCMLRQKGVIVQQHMDAHRLPNFGLDSFGVAKPDFI